jgi:hypothetical protein
VRTLSALRLGGVAVLLLAAAASAAQVLVSPDTTVSLATELPDDEDVVFDTGAGVFPVDMGTLPPEIDLQGFDVGGGARAFAIDRTAVIGGVTVRPQDVVITNGTLYVVVWDGRAEGLSPRVRVDALTYSMDELLLSFDTTTTLGGVTVDDEDLIRVLPGGGFSMEFDGTAEGLPEYVDLDGATWEEATGDLLLSFDVSGTVGGVDFDDEDVLRFEPGGGTWSMAYDGSAEHAGWKGGAVVALPEPGGAASLAIGLLAVQAVGRRVRSGREGGRAARDR